MVFIGLSIFFFLNLLDTIGVLGYSVFLFYPIKWLIILILTNIIPCGIFISGYQLLPFIYYLYFARRRQGFWDYILSIGAISLLCIDYFIYGKLNDWFDIGLWDITKILLFEVIMGVIVVVCFL